MLRLEHWKAKRGEPEGRAGIAPNVAALFQITADPTPHIAVIYAKGGPVSNARKRR